MRPLQHLVLTAVLLLAVRRRATATAHRARRHADLAHGPALVARPPRGQAGGTAQPPRRSDLPRRFTHPGLRGERPARVARLRAGLAALLWRAQRGQPGLQRRCDLAPAVAHRERRGGRHRAEGRGDPDRRQQPRPAALAGGGYCRRHRRHRRRNCATACRIPSCCCWAFCRRTGPSGPPRRLSRSTGRWRRVTGAAAMSPTSISVRCSCGRAG